MRSLVRGRYAARQAADASDIDRAQALRWRAFRPGAGPGRDIDGFDAAAGHFVVEERASGRLVACWRLLALSGSAGILDSYAAQFYDLAALSAYPGRMVEMGRFCVDPDMRDPDILRVAWALMTALVDAEKVDMLFGCSSFAGTRPEAYAETFALLKDRHIGPARWLPGVKAPNVFRFARRLRSRKPDPAVAVRAMPPLLRTYLRMGGWVSDHAVVDESLGTLHVFTGVEIGRVPAARARVLRALAG
ncbi:MAG: GNAT family N-acetyltransferase [Pseudomonadota bacterium]|jgi:putative hemolysin